MLSLNSFLIVGDIFLGISINFVKLQQEKYEVEKLKSDLEEKKESVADKRDNLKKLNQQIEQKLYNFQKLYEDEHRKF